MVVMVVREDDNVDRWECAEVDPRGYEPAWSGKGKGGRTLAPHRIGEHVDSTDLQQYGRVANPCRREIAGIAAHGEERLREWKALRARIWRQALEPAFPRPPNEVTKTAGFGIRPRISKTAWRVVCRRHVSKD